MNVKPVLSCLRASAQKLRQAARLALALPMLLAAVGSIALAASSSAMAAGDAEAGQHKAYTCLGCHGVKHYVNTYPTYHVPRIAGQHELYLIAALQAYRSKARTHPTMQANAALLSDQDIEDLAAWFASAGAQP